MATHTTRTNARGDTVHKAVIRRAGYKTMTATFSTDEEARFWAAGMEKAIDERRDVGAGDVTLATPVRAMLNKFVREVTPTKRGARSETQMIGALLERFRVFDKTLADFGPRDLEAVIAARLNGSADYAPVCGATVRRELGMLSGAFNHAIKKWHVAMVNPCSLVDRPKSNPHRTRRVEWAERKAICAKLGYAEGAKPTTKAQWVAWSFCFALETAMRRGEILSADWANYDADECELLLPMTKNGHARAVPITEEAAALLAVVRRDAGLIVPVNVSTFANIWNRAKKGETWEDIHFHDARHEATTQFADGLSNVLELAAVTGHKDLKSLQIYFNPKAKSLADKLNKRRRLQLAA